MLKVRASAADELPKLKRGALLVGLLNPYDQAAVATSRQPASPAFALEWLPRITRAQAMDVLSSQANIAGYKAVMLAAARIRPLHADADDGGRHGQGRARADLGAGVAGLQAIATAKRLGAVIEAFDVRPAVKEQVESLGAQVRRGPALPTRSARSAEGVGGYARPS